MEPTSAGDELLSQFKVANFTIDEESSIDFPKKANQSEATQDDLLNKSWDEIIPENERQKIDDEEKSKSEILLVPRQRNRVQKMARNEDSDEDEDEWSNEAGKRRRQAEDESESEESSDEDRPRAKRQKKSALHGFTEAEIRK